MNEWLSQLRELEAAVRQIRRFYSLHGSDTQSRFNDIRRAESPRVMLDSSCDITGEQITFLLPQFGDQPRRVSLSRHDFEHLAERLAEDHGLYLARVQARLEKQQAHDREKKRLILVQMAESGEPETARLYAAKLGIEL